MSFWRQAAIVTRRDLLAEGRSGEVWWVVLPFGLVSLFLIPVAVGSQRSLLADIGPGMFWTVVLLFGMFVTLRRSAQATPTEADVLALVVVDPAVVFVGRSIASFALVLVFQAVTAPAMVVLFGPDIPERWGWLLLLGPLTALGMAMTGTLAGGLVAGTRLGTTLAPLIAISLSFPLLVGASMTTSGLVAGTDILAPLILLTLVVVLVAIAGVLTARPLEESGA